ncbi:hypothetical protein B0J17DRAFT_625699 [Rhizoctonia solani]|nr:hypothetical protein B0J17DRAFT_625699 [Rhizoctonia solani]
MHEEPTEPLKVLESGSPLSLDPLTNRICGSTLTATWVVVHCSVGSPTAQFIGSLVWRLRLTGAPESLGIGKRAKLLKVVDEMIEIDSRESDLKPTGSNYHEHEFDTNLSTPWPTIYYITQGLPLRCNLEGWPRIKAPALRLTIPSIIYEYMHGPKDPLVPKLKGTL